MTTGRLLILDDEPEVGQTIRYVGESAGLDARFTADPDEFFRVVDEWNPTHIAIDLVMPQMDGVEVLVQLAIRESRARVIITSGVGQRVLDAAGRSAAEHGLDIAGVLPKPFSPTALRTMLVAPIATRATPGTANHRVPENVPDFSVTVADLRGALDRRELHVVYQPKVECATGTLAGFEALVRWVHPLRGVIMPDRFIPMAETNGLIDELTNQVLDQALEWFSLRFGGMNLKLSVNLSARTASGASLSMNLSARTLKNPHFVEHITERCVAREVDPARLIFELTETSAMEDPVASLDLLTRMRMKGFQLSIDDFGTGFSSMLQLVRLPFSEIKVDKSFVMTATRSLESRTVVKSIVDLGHSLGLHSTAEGVEDRETLDYLKDVGCDFAQGYYIARPMPGDAVPAWVASKWA